MDTRSPTASLDELLEELDGLLQRERDALRCLDSASVQAIQEKKLDIDGRLKAALAARPPSTRQVDGLRRCLLKLQSNQILLVHARNCLQGALQAASGQTPVSNGPRATERPVSLRVNIRG